jgi:hypothetical protein
LSGKDAQVRAVVAIIQRVRPDILLLNEFDSDFTNLALNAFRAELDNGDDAIDYPFFYAPIGNEGIPSWLDLDGNGSPDEWADAFGFGRFPSSEGMALLSRFPIDTQAARSFSLLKWQDLPDANLPTRPDGSTYLSKKNYVCLSLIFQITLGRAGDFTKWAAGAYSGVASYTTRFRRGREFERFAE